MQDESSVILIQDVPARAKTIIIDASLGPNGGHANVAEPWPSDAARGDASTPVPLGGLAWTWWCVALVLACSGARPRVTRYQPLGPWAMQI
jgi:hypothetical protein